MREEDTTFLEEPHRHRFCAIDWTASSNAHQYVGMKHANLLNRLGDIAFWCMLPNSGKSSTMKASKGLHDPVNNIGLGCEGMASDNQCPVSPNSRYLISQSADASWSEEDMLLWKEKILAFQHVLSCH